jgi:hypothetical protein
MNRALLQAAPDLKSIAALGDEQQKFKYFAQGRALADYIKSAKDDELATLMQDVTESKTNGFTAKVGKNGYYTVEADGTKPIKMNRDQLANWLSSQHVYKNTGDETALRRIEGISSNLAAQAKLSHDNAKDDAQIGNTGANYANTDATARARLGLEQSRANRPEMMELVDKASGAPVMFDARRMQFDKAGRAVLPEGLAYQTKQKQFSPKEYQETVKAAVEAGIPLAQARMEADQLYGRAQPVDMKAMGATLQAIEAAKNKARAGAPDAEKAPDTTRYSRTPVRGGYDYSSNQRIGKTKAEWARLDAEGK